MSNNDVAVQYRTAGGAIVTVYGRGFEYRAECAGCSNWTLSGNLKSWAQRHAQRCLALPRP
ncbi:hypothetical protein [Streptomyces sp. WAC05950]|uniref:hypothetical protein n=1 Tax=Streptomyces sp. WAC05950 TaxID=2487419 RepID=UPI000F73D99D|nr:hypothetical protein [Streptomyces sp. WAC05950]RSS84731.1 hypothetical protein EF904_37330 [Streptomyces sp. WAC05950]